MTFLTLDIETVPQARFVDPDAWPELDREYLNGDPGGDRIRADVAGGVAVLAATRQPAALHATTCHIVQVSFGYRESGDVQRRVLQANQYGSQTPTTVSDVGRVEPLLITEALNLLARACGKRTTLVTFNGKGFDLPLLRARALLSGATVPAMPCIPWRRLLYPFDDNQHADLRLILGNDDRRAKGTLQWWCDAFGIHAEEHGAEVYEWVRAGEWGKLEEYGMTEAQTLVELYERVLPVL